MQTCLEKEKSLPVVAEVDVLVAGGGPAGVGAALGAARNGAKTMLIEQANCLGGMATSGMMSTLLSNPFDLITCRLMVQDRSG